MNTMKRKIISLILAIATVISLIPTNIFVFSTDDAASAEYGDVLASFGVVATSAKLYPSTSLDAKPLREIDITAIGHDGVFRIVEYYETPDEEKFENIGTLNTIEAVYRYRIHSDDLPAEYAGYAWVNAVDLTNIHQDDILEDTTLRGKQIHIVGHYDENGLLVEKFHKNPIGYLHDSTQEKLFDWYEEDKFAIFTIGDVYKTPWGTWYYVTIEDEIYAEYNGEWVNATDTVFVEEDEEILIEGQVGITQGGEELTEITIARGQKEYVFTELDENLGKAVSYQWQILIDAENDRWANIYDGIYSYATISEALVCNILDDFGQATIRCIVTKGGLKYVSGELVVTLSDYEKTIEDEEDVPVLDTVAQDESINQDKFEVTVEYKFLHQNNLEVMTNTTGHYAPPEPFVRTLKTGLGYSGTATSPYEMGYMPYREISKETYDDKYAENPDAYLVYTAADNKIYYLESAPTEVFTNVFADSDDSVRTRIVYYVPQPVNYRVNYYEQNVYDDEYTSIGSVSKTGLADELVNQKLGILGEDTFANIPKHGFVLLGYDVEQTIEPDNSTTVNIYYDREYYLVDFELGEDGYDVTPLYVRYGYKVTLGTPKRPGYEFNGWNLKEVTINNADGTETNVDTTQCPAKYRVTAGGSSFDIEHHNLLYKAQWKETTVNYTVIYWKENADDDNFSFWGYTEQSSTTGTTVTITNTAVPNATWSSDRAYFTYNAKLSDKSAVVKGDGTTAINLYYLRNTYSLTFIATGQCGQEEHTHCTATCTQNHEHCNAVCTLDVHVHSDSCTKVSVSDCEFQEHEHTDACNTTVENSTCYLKCGEIEHISHDMNCIDGTRCTTACTTHTNACYEGAGDRLNAYYQGRVTGTKDEGYIGQIQGWGTYYIYISGAWYNYTGQIKYNKKAEPTKCEGHHSDNCYICETHEHTNECYSTQEHTHGVDGCYTCGRVEHLHDASCVKSCTKPTHTHTGDCNSNNQTNNVTVVTAKYGADISDIWPITNPRTDTVYDQGERWKPEDKAVTYNQVLVFIPIMPPEDIKFTVDSGAGKSEKTLTYYLEALEGGYFLYHTTTARYGHFTKDEDFFDIRGFTQGATDPTQKPFENSSIDSLKLYYTRNNYKLQFTSLGKVLVDLEQTVPYDAAMAQYRPSDLTPPSDVEKNSIQFAGWYLTPDCADGTKYDFANETMQDGNLMLYAKWVPTYWNVEVYLDENATAPIATHNNVRFGDPISEPTKILDDAKTQEPYKDMRWVGWFYRDADNNELPYHFDAMTIKQDYLKSEGTHIYGKWSDKIPVEYTIKYQIKVVENGEPKYIDIAHETRGSEFVGRQKTVYPKTNLELFEGYQVDYFPNVRSHQMTIERSSDSDSDSANVYTFLYTKAEAEVPYTVKHTFVSDDFKEVLGTNTFTYECESDDSEHAKVGVYFYENVTEENVFKRFQNQDLTPEQLKQIWHIVTTLSPDAYYKELILEYATNEDEAKTKNVLEFHWRLRGDTTIYEVIHYTQPLYQIGTTPPSPDTVEYEVYHVERYEVELDPDPSKNQKKATPITINGFNQRTKDSTLTGQATALKYEGNQYTGYLVLKIYYDRKPLEYTVKHYFQNAQNSFVEDTTLPQPSKKAYFGAVVTEEAVKKDGYSPDKTSQRQTITQEGQVIEFYYTPMIVNIYYAVYQNKGGNVNPSNEVFSMNLAKPAGAVPDAFDGYKFEGWYKDSSCTIPITISDGEVDDDGYLYPEKPSGVTNGMNIYYYAKFVPTISSLTIQNRGVADYEADQAMIYQVVGSGYDGTPVSMIVTVIGDGSVTIENLPIGSYTVSEQGDWSWRYAAPKDSKDSTQDGSGTIVLQEDADENIILFTYSTPNTQWLSDNDYAEN